MLFSWVDVSRWRSRVSSSRPPDLSLARWKGDGVPPRSPTHRRWHIIVLASAQVTKEGGSPSVSPVHLPMTHGSNISRVNRSRRVRVVTTDTELRHFLSHRNCSYFLSLPLSSHYTSPPIPSLISRNNPHFSIPFSRRRQQQRNFTKKAKVLACTPTQQHLFMEGDWLGGRVH